MRYPPTVLRNWRTILDAALDLRDTWRMWGWEACIPHCHQDGPGCDSARKNVVEDCAACLRECARGTERLG